LGEGALAKYAGARAAGWFDLGSSCDGEPVTLATRALVLSPELSEVAARVVCEHQAAPCAVIATTRTGPVVGAGASSSLFVGTAGRLSFLDEASPVQATTVFDLASITKSYTAVLAARLAKLDRLSLQTPIDELVVEAQGTPLAGTTIERLLAHRSGLLPHIQVFLPLLFGKTIDKSTALREVASSKRPECGGPPDDEAEGYPPVYSDLGYLLVGEAMQRVEDRPLAELVAREIGAFTGSRVVASAQLSDAERAMVAPTEQVDFRGGLVQGIVHDENAWAIGGREMCGHAGLFGTAPDVALFGTALLQALRDRHPDWLAPSDLRPLVRPRPLGTLRAGFDGKTLGAGASSSGERFGPRTFGHLGFTGTSLWMDPDSGICCVLLTNRVHPTRENVAIKRARPDVYDRVDSWWSFVHESLQSAAP
jgi:serine-type D-Ala-D-Ala carboxypeptidase